MSKNRTALDFVACVRRAFGYLREFGFVETSRELTLVRFSRGDVDVSVFHGRSSYEISVDVSWAGQPFTMGELLKLVRPTAASSYRPPAATTTEQTARWVSAVAEQFTAIVPLLLDALPVALKRERQREAEVLELDVRTSQVRPKAAAAFHDKRYAEAARLYRLIESRLSGVERQKLALADRRSRPD
jgi:hypothetical protein